jgi:phage terminase small subunit
MKRSEAAKLVAVAGGSGAPEEPDWTAIYSDEADADAARAQWGVVVRELRDGQTLTVANGHMIQRLVLFRVEFERASRNVAERGTILSAKRTGVPQVNPYWPIMQQASAAIRLLEIELGLPPVRRGKASKVTREKKNSRAADAYLRPVAKS